MNTLNLSYVITTRNKLPFLKVMLARLIDNLHPDEEIVIVDGASSDGTCEYLKDLHSKGKIQQFLSEPDFSEGHGFNKGVFLAKGKLIKVITDDDYFNYTAINDCKNYMLENKDVDVIIGYVCTTPIENFDKIICEESTAAKFKRWQISGECFPFTGLSLMIRRKTLALTGLLCSKTNCPDTEFAMRITSLNINMAWCNAIISIRAENDRSNLRNAGHKLLKKELDRFYYFYDSRYRKQKNKIIYMLYRKVRSFLGLIKNYCIQKIQYKYELSNSGIDSDDTQFINHKCILEFNQKCEEYVCEDKNDGSIIY